MNRPWNLCNAGSFLVCVAPLRLSAFCLHRVSEPDIDMSHTEKHILGFLPAAFGVTSRDATSGFSSSTTRFYASLPVRPNMAPQGHKDRHTLPFGFGLSSSRSLSFMIHSNNVAPRRRSSSGVRDLKNQSNLPRNHQSSSQSYQTIYLNNGHSPISRLIKS